MGEPSYRPELPELVPLFPLPNVVLFPRAVLPLHVFEERYKAMIGDVLRTHRQLAMAMLRPGWQRNYYGRPAIDPVVCVGTIVSHEQLADGRYNLLLQGHTRARVIREQDGEAYRRARLIPLGETQTFEIDLEQPRRQLAEMFSRPSYQALPAGRQFHQMLSSPVPTSAIADLLAFTVLPDDAVEFKQSLLAEADPCQRVWRVVDALKAMAPRWQNVPEDAHLN